jgi:hypothetical protein
MTTPSFPSLFRHHLNPPPTTTFRQKGDEVTINLAIPVLSSVMRLDFCQIMSHIANMNDAYVVDMDQIIKVTVYLFLVTVGVARILESGNMWKGLL